MRWLRIVSPKGPERPEGRAYHSFTATKGGNQVLLLGGFNGKARLADVRVFLPARVALSCCPEGRNTAALTVPVCASDRLLAATSVLQGQALGDAWWLQIEEEQPMAARQSQQGPAPAPPVEPQAPSVPAVPSAAAAPPAPSHPPQPTSSYSSLFPSLTNLKDSLAERLPDPLGGLRDFGSRGLQAFMPSRKAGQASTSAAAASAREELQGRLGVGPSSAPPPAWASDLAISLGRQLYSQSMPGQSSSEPLGDATALQMARRHLTALTADSITMHELAALVADYRNLVDLNGLRVLSEVSGPPGPDMPVAAVLKRGADVGLPGRFYHFFSDPVSLADIARSLRLDDIPLLLEDYATLVAKADEDNGL